MGKVLRIREVGDPILLIKCKEVDINNISKEILEEIEDMKETLNFTEGFGIAAPQVGIDKRIAIIQVEKERCTYKDSEDVPTTVMINPTWKKLSEETEIEYEGCLSVPSVRGKVERYKEIEVSYYNEKGEKVIKQVKGFTARDIQHECDHLDGIIFLDKVVGPNGFATTAMMKKFNLKEER
ncbi:MAG: peptide deformylase [Clostridia bacterium]|nr:peptide deformylase [Clostridia bacterium]